MAKQKKRGGKAAKCWCGCGEQVVAGRRFRQGHDARYKGWAKQVARGQLKRNEIPGRMPDRAASEFRELVANIKGEKKPEATATEPDTVVAVEA